MNANTLLFTAQPRRFSLKEYAYLYLREAGFTPRQAMEIVRHAIKVSAATDSLFEKCLNIACEFLAIPPAFSRD